MHGPIAVAVLSTAAISVATLCGTAKADPPTPTPAATASGAPSPALCLATVKAVIPVDQRSDGKSSL